MQVYTTSPHHCIHAVLKNIIGSMLFNVHNMNKVLGCTTKIETEKDELMFMYFFIINVNMQFDANTK